MACSHLWLVSRNRISLIQTSAVSKQLSRSSPVGHARTGCNYSRRVHGAHKLRTELRGLGRTGDGCLRGRHRRAGFSRGLGVIASTSTGRRLSGSRRRLRQIVTISHRRLRPSLRRGLSRALAPIESMQGQQRPTRRDDNTVWEVGASSWNRHGISRCAVPGHERARISWRDGGE